ncbi:MAG: helix-turn-helix transcriptional regulator, partial [Bacteroidota bacterium]
KFFFNHLTISDALQYKVSYSYKMRGKNGNYFQSLHQTTALSLTENNSIGHVLGIETNIEHLFNRPKKSISFIDLKTQNHYLNIDVDDPDFKDNIKFPHGYTQQEIKIIELISYGHSSEEIAEILSLSNHTVKTHRANILSKSPSKKMTSVIADLFRQGYL